MDHLQTRLDTLEQQMHTINRRLHWWRGLACSVIVLALLTWALPAGTGEQQGLAQRVAALEDLLKHFSREKNEVFITGANLHIRNGLGSTDCFDEQVNEIPDCPNALGNLIVGYNEPRGFEPDVRTGSHNVVVGEGHSFSHFGGIVVGRFNTISGVVAAVIGGEFNTASGGGGAVSGGFDNRASGNASVVSGGASNTASDFAAVIGGALNTASGGWSTVSGGHTNTASGNFASVNGEGSTPLPKRGRVTWLAGICLRSVEGVATRPAVSSPPSAAGRILPKTRSSAGRRAQKPTRSWWATSAPRSLPRQGSSTGSPAASSKTSRVCYASRRNSPPA
jgi:hypothetical protein